MSRRAALVFLHAESPIHAGTGAAAGVIDLPIQRAVQSTWPIVNDSTMKGAFKKVAPGNLLGDDDNSGRIAIPDARLLLFPVASPKGVMAWVTCAWALRDLGRQLDLVGSIASSATRAVAAGLRNVLDKVGEGAKIDEAWIPGDTLAWPVQGKKEKYVLLADQKFDVPRDADRAATCEAAAEQLREWFTQYATVFESTWTTHLAARIVIVHDDVFTHLASSRTEIRTRIAIEDGHAGNLWTEENLPVDSLMYLTLTAMFEAEELTTFCKKAIPAERPLVQLGGDQGLGRGWFRMRALVDPEAS